VTVGNADESDYDSAHSSKLFYWRMTPGRIASAILWVGYVVFAVWRILFGDQDLRCLMMPVGMILPMCFIWFADSLAGINSGVGAGVMRLPAQPALLAACGWVMLAGPPVFLILGLTLRLLGVWG
jgi:hypothetical protein